MIERICPRCKVPMLGEKCIKESCGCNTQMSSTIYWCPGCNIPMYDKICSICGTEGNYIATDIRPVFPEEQLLVELILDKPPFYYRHKSVWYSSNSYIIDGKKQKIAISKINKWDLDKIKEIKESYEAYKNDIYYTTLE